MSDREMVIRQNVRTVAVEAERHRILGIILAEVGRLKLAGEYDTAQALVKLALRIEHPNAA